MAAGLDYGGCSHVMVLAVVHWPEKRTDVIATYGAFLACCGVVTIGRPVIRAGGYIAWFERSRVIDAGHFEPAQEEITEANEQQKDALAVQCIGPTLVVIGTLLSGLSGFLK